MMKHKAVSGGSDLGDAQSEFISSAWAYFRGWVNPVLRGAGW